MSSKVAGITLQEDEQLLHDLRPKWSAWFWTIVLTFGFAIPFIWWERRRTRYIITDKRAILKRSGVFSTSTDGFRLEDVTRLNTQQGMGETFLGGGTVLLDAGPDELELSAVPKYSQVAASIREAQGL